MTPQSRPRAPHERPRGERAHGGPVMRGLDFLAGVVLGIFIAAAVAAVALGVV